MNHSIRNLVRQAQGILQAISPTKELKPEEKAILKLYSIASHAHIQRDYCNNQGEVNDAQEFIDQNGGIDHLCDMARRKIEQSMTLTGEKQDDCFRIIEDSRKYGNL